jgi:hypothetical protein
MQVYALTSSQSLRETLDLFLTREAAEAELREILQDEPDWKDVLRVVPIQFDERRMSANQKGDPPAALLCLTYSAFAIWQAGMTPASRPRHPVLGGTSSGQDESRPPAPDARRSASDWRARP